MKANKFLSTYPIFILAYVQTFGHVDYFLVTKLYSKQGYHCRTGDAVAAKNDGDQFAQWTK